SRRCAPPGTTAFEVEATGFGFRPQMVRTPPYQGSRARSSTAGGQQGWNTRRSLMPAMRREDAATPSGAISRMLVLIRTSTSAPQAENTGSVGALEGFRNTSCAGPVKALAAGVPAVPVKKPSAVNVAVAPSG